MFWIILGLPLVVLGARTVLWHLQCWQLREYRFDRLQAWLKTEDGKIFWYPWIQPGLLPRPKLSGRVLMMFGILGFINLTLILATYYLIPPSPYLLLLILIWERTLFVQVAVAVWISGIPAQWKKRKLFTTAAHIVAQNPDIIRVGITGSYGKSSTKEVLVHLLKDHFGEAQVLYNPANENNETAIARLIIKNKSFFKPSMSPFKKGIKGVQKILVIETGAYKQGEIATVCSFIKPHIGILTGLNQQHIELFGSQANIAAAKFELPQAVSDKVFFNANNDLLVSLFEDQNIKATKIGIQTGAAQNLVSHLNKSDFHLYNQDFTLPWPGVFFVENALLAIECCRELGLTPKNLAASLKNIPPLQRALSLETHPQGFALLKDTYSANPDGVLQAISHLGNFPGKKIFVGIPLRELGTEALAAHQQIFNALKDIQAKVYWCKPDFVTEGQSILGENFQVLKDDPQPFEAVINNLKSGDAVLLESKLPDTIFKILA